MSTQEERRLYPWPLTEDAIRLAATLKVSCKETPKILLFTGVAAQEGVSTIVAQVALALAQMNQGPVLLLDANLRTPSTHAIFNVQQIPGLSDVLKQRVTAAEAIHPSRHPQLSILPSGAGGEEASILFSNTECSTLLQKLRQEFRFVIVDSSSPLAFVDTTLFIPHVDDVVITLAAGAHRRQELIEVKRLLDRLRANILGLILCKKKEWLSR